MADKIISDVNGFEPGELIDLFELDMSTGVAASTEPVFRWHAGYNENLQEIVWQGNRYSAFPIEASGFEWSGKGSLPRPTLTVANITSLLSGVLSSYDDLVGSKVTRKRTFAKYLDAYCYTGGYPVGGVCSGESGGTPYSLSKSDCLDATKNGSAGTWTVYTSSTCASSNSNTGIWYASANADDMAYFPEEIWYVDRKALETRTHIEFELTAAHDVQGVKLPGRTVVANTCPWKYKGGECGYDTTTYPGGSCSNSTYTTQETCEGNSDTWTPRYYDIDNNSTNSSGDDVCAKNFQACELRFPEPQELPFGGFPGAGMNMG